MVKFHKNLRNGNSLSHNFFDDRIFGTLDVHLKDVDSAVTLKAHGRGQPGDRQPGRLPAVLASVNHGMRNPIRSGWQVKNLVSVVRRDP